MTEMATSQNLGVVHHGRLWNQIKVRGYSILDFKFHI